MARSDKVQFRREFTLTSNGYVGSSEGFFVGDILSLHVDFLGEEVSYLIQGKVGRQGIWVNLPNKGHGHISDLDIRAYEYVRIEVFNIDTSINVIMFGYEENVKQDSIIAKLSGNEERINLENNDNLKQIKNELIKLNQYMEIITGDKVQ